MSYRRSVTIATIGRTLHHFGGSGLISNWKESLQYLNDCEFRFVDAPDLSSIHEIEELKDSNIWIVEGTILINDFSRGGRIPALKRDINYLVGIFLEPFAQIGLENHPNLKDYVDLNIGFSRNSQVRFLYSPHLHLEILKRKKDPDFSLRLPKVAAFVSANNSSFRTEVLKNLMESFPTDSFGSLFNNFDPCKLVPRSSRYESNWRGGKRTILEKYMFSFCFENQILSDYVSEKVLDGLASGTIPIYWGCDEVYDLIPDRNAIINYRDFRDTKALCAYLEEVVHSPELQKRHLEYPSLQKYQLFVDTVIKAQKPWIVTAVERYIAGSKDKI